MTWRRAQGTGLPFVRVGFAPIAGVFCDDEGLHVDLDYFVLPAAVASGTSTSLPVFTS